MRTGERPARVTELSVSACAATEFAEMMGFPRTNLSTAQSVAQWHHWKQTQCQPNFWKVGIIRFALFSIDV